MDDLVAPDKYIQISTELTIYMVTRMFKLYDLAVSLFPDYLNLP